MSVLGIVLIGAGVAAIAVGALQVRAPLATIRQLDATEADLRRYESWRGKQTGVGADGPTGADEMRAQMRQRVILWALVIGAGVVSIVAGLLVG